MSKMWGGNKISTKKVKQNKRTTKTKDKSYFDKFKY